MKELERPDGVYKKWHPLKEHQEDIASFYKDMTSLISECWVSGFWSIVRIDDLRRFNSETKLCLEPYPLAAYGCLLMIANEYGNLTSEVFFDRVEKVHSKLEKAESYARSDLYYGPALSNVILTPVAKNLTFREVKPLQLADFFIWELQRNHLNADEWHALPGRPTDGDERWAAFQAWSLYRFGLPQPPARKSLGALVESAAPVSGIIWDYDQLRIANNLRKGYWP